MANKLVEYQLRIRSADNLSDALTITSVRGGTNPYISSEPSGDGASYDPITGVVTSGSYSVRVVDPITSGTSRLFTSVMEDANFRQQLGHRRAFLELREDGGGWQTMFAGRLTRYNLASDIEWEIALGDFMEAEHKYTAFDPHESDSFADYLARWPNRGCILGGPIRNGFLHVQDLGGWQFKIGGQSSVGGLNWTRLDFVSGYDMLGQPIASKGQRLEDVRNAINGVAEKFWEAKYEASVFGAFPDLRVLVDGTAYEPVLYGADAGSVRRPRELLGRTLLSPCSLWLGGTVGVVGTTVRVHVISSRATVASPVYWTGHPVDLLVALWTEAALPYSAAAVSTVRDTIGRGARISLQIDTPQNIGRLAEEAVYGPWGIGVRMSSAGELEMFSGRIFANTVPATTITSADVVEGSTQAFELDAAEAIRTVVIEHTRLVQPVLYNVLGQPYPDPNATAALVRQVERFERTTDDPGAIGTGEASFIIPGMIGFSLTAAVRERMNVRSWADGRAHEVFDRFGRGPIRLRTTILRTSAAMSAKLGDEILVNLPQLPKANKRLVDDGTVTARAMQIAQLTPTLAGNEIECIDSGPNASPVATLPTMTVAKSTSSPRSIADLTITNAAALNAASMAVRVQIAVTSGAAPAAADYTDVLYFRATEVPTTATQLPPVSANGTVYVRARSEQNGARPSNWTAASSVALDPLNAPTAPSATPSGSDGSKCDLAWTVGANATNALTEVWLRLQSEAFSAAVLKAVLPAGSNFYRLEELTPGTLYTASVRHEDESTIDRSALTEVNFTAGATTVTLAAPDSPDGFSLPERTLDRPIGTSRSRGTGDHYGMVVRAQVFPSDVEFEEAVETGVGTGVYGSYAAVGRVASVAGDWTMWSRTVPADRLRRKLRARHARTGSTASSYTAEVVVDPTAYDAIALFPQGPTLDVNATPGASSFTINYTVNATTFEYSVDGAAFTSVPASGFTVSRPAAGANDRTLTFRASMDGQTITNTVTVPAIDKDTVTPDLSVAQTAQDAIQTNFQATASNPSGGAAPSLTFSLVNCTAIGYSGAGPHTISSGTIITVNRPAFSTSQATVRFLATLAGGGAEEISRTVPAQAFLRPRGAQCNVNPEFRGLGTGSLSGYTVYDNNATGRVTIAVAADSATPNGSGYRARVTVAAPGAAISPGVGGISIGIGPDSGVHAPGTYHRGGELYHIVRANIPSGYTLNMTSNDYGTAGGGSTEMLTPAYGTGAYATYVWRQKIGTSGTFSTIGFLYLTGPDAALQWDIALWDVIDVNQPEQTGPNLRVWAVEGSTSVTVYYEVGNADSFVYRTDNGSDSSVPASGFTVSRNAAGGATKVLTFTAELAGQRRVQTLEIAPQVTTPGTTPIVNNVRVTATSTTSDNITVAWDSYNAPGGATFDLEWSLGGAYHSANAVTTISGVTSPYVHGSGGTGGHGLDLVNGGTLENIYYRVLMKSGSTVLAASEPIGYQIDHA